MARKFKKSKSQSSKPNTWRSGEGSCSSTISDYSNANLEKYYNAIIRPEEQEAFWRCLKTPLPTSFRVISGTVEERLLADKIRLDFNDLVEPLPVKIANAYRVRSSEEGSGSRRELRKSPQYAPLHDFLVMTTQGGTVVRQEAVSMLPPSFLNINSPSLTILDMCAAPGSKTSQLLEYLNKASTGTDGVTGCVIANDVDKNRAYMLHHQVRRLHSPALLVTCNDASMYPKLRLFSGEALKFDRVLCDVPCSGDGTLRKTPSIWTTWTPHQAFGLHPLQARILARGLQLLKPGGRLVYSTCSLNPIEDEAVIASVLVKYPDCRLVNVNEEIGNMGLRVENGRTSWSVMTSSGEFINQINPDIGKQLRLKESFFPPQNIHSMNMDFTFRILPHHQDTGGFYIAVIEKLVVGGDSYGDHEDGDAVCVAVGNKGDECDLMTTDDIKGTVVDENTKVATTTPDKANEEDDCQVYHPLHPSIINPILKCYLQKDLSGTFLTRSLSHSTPAPKSILYTTKLLHDLILFNKNVSALHVVNVGVRAFEKYEPSARHSTDEYVCGYRILGELIGWLNINWLSPERLLRVNRGVFGELMRTDSTVKGHDCDVSPGGAVAICERDDDNSNAILWIPIWKTGDGWMRPFLSKQDRPLLMDIFNQ